MEAVRKAKARGIAVQAVKKVSRADRGPDMPEIGIARRKYKATGLGEMVYRANVKALEFFNTELVWRESN